MKLDEALSVVAKKGHKQCTFVSMSYANNLRFYTVPINTIFRMLCFEQKYNNLLESTTWEYYSVDASLRKTDDQHCELILDKLKD